MLVSFKLNELKASFSKYTAISVPVSKPMYIYAKVSTYDFALVSKNFYNQKNKEGN